MKRLTLPASLACLFMVVIAGQCAAQTIISGTITDKNTGYELSSVTILIPGTNEGTFTDERGHFSLTTHHPLPVSIVISNIGYRSDTITIYQNTRNLQIALSPSEVLGREIVVAASRVPESILKSPVSIEHIGLQTIRQTPASGYYDIIGNIKGVNMVTSGLLFSTPTTRGFGGSGNTGMNQFVDGMDNQSPGLNFSVSNVIGISVLDIDNIELLPGASSALYGAGGTNGTLLMTGKDPFQYQGLSALVKGGIMHIHDPRHGATPYQEYAVRYAKAFNNKIAFKLNVSYIKAYDWMAADTTDYDAVHFKTIPGTRLTDPNYDGLNVYGDETSANMQDVANSVLAAATQQYVAQYEQQAGTPPSQAQINSFLSTNPTSAPFYKGMQAGIIPDQNVSRTGYNEKYLVDYNTYNLKLGGELAYKITPDMKISLEGHYGKGTTVYTGSDRYSLKNFHIGQYKIQLNGKHFMLRGYTTQENAGDAYNATILGQLMNEAWKPSQQWFPQYVGAFAGAKALGAPDQQAFVAARSYADNGMPQPGSLSFNHIKDSLSALPIPSGGRFTDKSALYQYDGLYNFSDQIPFIGVQAGANFRRYHLNSDGTIFDDKGKKLTSDQWGMFLQATKDIVENRIKLTGAIRYDKIQNFEGKWTPRIAAVFTVAPENNIRISYQTGYQLPTNQQQFIDLNVGRARLIGGIPQFFPKYNLNDDPGFPLANVTQYGAAYATGYQANIQKGDPPPVAQYNAAVAAEKVLVPYQYKTFQPETVKSFEAGYRGVIHQKLMLDAYVYFSNYTDFIGSIILIQAKNGPQQIAPQDPKKYYGPQLANDQTRNVYQMYINSAGTVQTWGWALGGEYLLPADYKLNANISYNKLSNAPDGFFTQFNTPDYTANIGFGNPNVINNWGFSIHYHYQDAFLYEGSFAVGNVSAVNTVDAQITYQVPKIKLSFALGGTDILNHYYQNAFGNPMIGGLYYLSAGYNVK
ncbi:MAG: TonB-dependent receptor [Chitinophagaceae bacterium]|nr:MAG: TonB-dependent receptor [Chitinophagaceae bacterium]